MSTMEKAVGLLLSVTSKRGFRYEGKLIEVNSEEGQEVMILNEVVMIGKVGSVAARKRLDKERHLVIKKNELADLRIISSSEEDNEESDYESEESDEPNAYDDDADDEDVEVVDCFSSYHDSDSDVLVISSDDEGDDFVSTSSTSGISTGQPSPKSEDGKNSQILPQTREECKNAFDNFLQLFEAAEITEKAPVEDQDFQYAKQYEANLVLDFPCLGQVKQPPPQVMTSENVPQPTSKTPKRGKRKGKKGKQLYSKIAAIPGVETYQKHNFEINAQANLVNGEWVLPLPEQRDPKLKPEIVIPLEMDDVVRNKLNDFKTITPMQSKVRETLSKMVSEGLNKDNYQQYIAFLLYVEELELEWELERHDMYSVKLFRKSDKHPVMLTVPGIIDKNPNVIKGDTVRVYIHKESFELIVEDVYFNQISFLKSNRLMSAHFDYSLSGKHKGERMEEFADVQFTVNEACLKSMHRGILLTEPWQIARLFPKIDGDKDAKLKKNDEELVEAEELDLFNPTIANNKEQLEFILGVVNGTAMPYPHILFGPPGTGKTVTVVEAIKQVWLNQPSARLLVTAPSNTAADLLAERLFEDVPKEDIVRWIAPSREDFPVNPAIEEIVRSGKMPLSSITKYRILVVTLATSARILNAGTPVGTITHVFVDEAGQATEPETLIPVAGILGVEGRMILSGDPNQLGPVVKSKLADSHGLGTSLLERLMTKCPLYGKDPKTGLRDARYITKLKKNFRSHPDLLRLPSALFYDNELEPQMDAKEMSTLSNLEWVQRKGCPLIFHGTKAVHGKSSNSHSIFNVLEVEKVVEYVRRLSQVLDESKIGIVSPYKRQVRMIKEEVKKKLGFKDILIGSTEEFQGQEREAMIISTVRSSFGQNVFENLEELDKYEIDEETGEILVQELGVSLIHNRPRVRKNPAGLGFLVNRKRFNVAITRAKSLMIVIGDPFLLQHNHNWRELIKYAYVNGGYIGTDLGANVSDKWDKLKTY